MCVKFSIGDKLLNSNLLPEYLMNVLDFYDSIRTQMALSVSLSIQLTTYLVIFYFHTTSTKNIVGAKWRESITNIGVYYFS